jgi:hypothetical protein
MHTLACVTTLMVFLDYSQAVFMPAFYVTV